ncbi:hypothetical protein [Klebsiella pneumoniae]|uniref:hypothetical protein n=1 Tax=Enterobacteriaceae TaxID=543 RepID=UPI0020346814|nr:hypothetical protein [Klebsiella pneumoniae]MCM2145393.1 hypothetical protein [Klebsiella pneumoniae]
MPVDFLTTEQTESYGRFTGEPDELQLARYLALLQIVGGDKLIIPFADGAAHEPIQRPAFSA